MALFFPEWVCSTNEAAALASKLLCCTLLTTVLTCPITIMGIFKNILHLLMLKLTSLNQHV